MALVAAPQGGLTFRINPGDGSIAPCDPGGSGKMLDSGRLPSPDTRATGRRSRSPKGSGKPVLFQYVLNAM